MKIVFMGFASSYTHGMTYQDNMLCNEAIKDRHEVTYLSNPEGYVNGQLCELKPENTILSSGLHLIRLPYVKCLNKTLTKKLRLFKGVYKILEEEQPDVIFCHNSQYSPIIDAAKYKKNNPNVRFYIDTHADYGNSGRNFLSLHILHRIYYRHLLNKVLPLVDKYYYISEDTKRFAIDNYKVPESIMEYFPLGGVVLENEEYNAIRCRRRAELGLSEEDILYLHSGKLDVLKNTKELLEAYNDISDDQSKMVIIGSIPEEQKSVLLPLIDKNDRIIFLGWKSGEELNEFLCACDIYCQPGSASATLQNAICRNCAIMANPLPQYKVGLNGFGNIFWVSSTEEIKSVFQSVKANPGQIRIMKTNSNKCASELLDYKILSARIYQ